MTNLYLCGVLFFIYHFDKRNSGDHIEVIVIDFDPTKITYLQLLDLFWNNHEYGLTTRVKRQYSSVIYYHTEKQKRIASESLEKERVNRSSEEIITAILETPHFYPAEEWVFEIWFFSPVEMIPV